jgi:hypothetical protein
VLLCILGSPLIASTPSPNATKQGEKRIAEIEKDFDVKFVQKSLVSLGGQETEFWVFLKMDPTSYSFKGYPFMVRAGAKDVKVQDAIASALCCASFYEEFLKRMRDAKPKETPSGLQLRDI